MGSFSGADEDGLLRLAAALGFAADEAETMRGSISVALAEGDTSSEVPGLLDVLAGWCRDEQQDVLGRALLLAEMDSEGLPGWLDLVEFLAGDVGSLIGLVAGSLAAIAPALGLVAAAVDVAVLIDPSHDGWRGVADRAVAAAQLAGMLLGFPLVVVGASVYVLASFLYDHRDAIGDAITGGAANLADGLVGLADQVAADADAALGQIADGLRAVGDACDAGVDPPDPVGVPPMIPPIGPQLPLPSLPCDVFDELADLIDSFPTSGALGDLPGWILDGIEATNEKALELLQDAGDVLENFLSHPFGGGGVPDPIEALSWGVFSW